MGQQRNASFAGPSKAAARTLHRSKDLGSDAAGPERGAFPDSDHVSSGDTKFLNLQLAPLGDRLHIDSITLAALLRTLRLKKSVVPIRAIL